MGNTCSHCFRRGSRERQEVKAEQRLQNNGKRSRRTILKIAEEDSVTPETSTEDRSDALCTNVQDNGLGNPDLPLEVSQPEVAPGQAALLETDALPTQVKPDAKASAIVTDSVHVVDNSLFLHQQEVAARFVLQLLADATKVVASKYLDEMPDKGDSLPMETDEGDSLLKSRLSQPEVVPAALLEAEAQMKPDAKVSAVVNDSVNVNAASTVYNSQFLHQHEVAARFVSQLLADATKILVTEKGDSLLEADVPADVISVHVDAWSALDMSTFLQQQEVAARLVSKLLTDATEIMASYLDPDSGKEERKVCQAESQASPIKDLMTQDKSALRESQTETSAATDSQVAATLFESQGAEAKENVEDIILPQEDATIAITAQKLVDRLVQNPSAEDVVKGFSLVTDTDVHLESYEHQALLNKLHVEDGDIPAAKLYKRIIFMEKPKTQGSSVQIPEHYIAGHLELPDDHSAALDIGPQYERPRSADRLTPMSDESDAWLTCEEDLYHSEEEVESEPVSQGLMKMAVPEQDQGSLELPVDILIYSEREWREQTDKNIVIRKGYILLSHSFRCLRQVRKDNYSALRASLYQALMSSSQQPDWLQKETFLLIPEELESRYGIIKDWPFPDICKQMFCIRNAVDHMRHYLRLLQKWWQSAAACSGLEGRRRVCEQLFQGGEEEFGIMEALKLLMLARAMEFYTAMKRGDDVPFLFWLLFAQDTASCPHTFLANHQSQVSFSGGMEQMEMILLGYVLQCTIKVYRLHRANTQEFITYYPVDHLQDWPSVCLVTKDDHHYNVPVGHPTHPLWRTSMIGQPAFLRQLDCSLK